jgi:hypothetical protein
MKWLALQLQQDCDVDKVDRRATRPRIAMGVFSLSIDELRLASDTSNIISVIGELCLKISVNVVRICVFLQEKANDYSLLPLHPAVKILNVQRRQNS